MANMTRDEAVEIINTFWNTNRPLFHRLRDAACDRAIERIPNLEEIGSSDMWHFVIEDLRSGEYEYPRWSDDDWRVVPGLLGANVLA